jgi:transitional endoplasmic reticulum ATPase
MQRSFLLVCFASLVQANSVYAFFLDDVNEFFTANMLFFLDDLNQEADSSAPHNKPRYEKEPPHMPNEQQPVQRVVTRGGIVMEKDQIRLANVVGQDAAVASIAGVLEQFRNPRRLARFGGEPKKGILLEGPSGTGKTLLANAIANELGFKFFECSASSFNEVYVGLGAQRVREMFEQARQNAPSLIFIDEIDAVTAVNRSGSSDNGAMEYRQTTIELLTQMNKIDHNSGVLVVCATNTIEAVDEAFKAPHRFEVVTVGLPTEQGRLDTFRHYLNRLPLVAFSEEMLSEAAATTKGFSQAQIKSVVNNAVQFAIMDKTAEKVTDVHVKAALEMARETMKTTMFGSKGSEYDKVYFSDIGGMDETLDAFKFLVRSLNDPDSLKRHGVTPPKGILMAGPPGCGKTMIARALANEANCKLLYASGSSFDTKYAGEGAETLRSLFKQASMISPAIIFIDEIDALSLHTSTQLLTLMDGFFKDANVIVIGATNRPEAVDSRLRREERFSSIITVSLPGDEERRSILERYIVKLPLVNLATVPWGKLVLHTKNFSGAALKSLVNDAATRACMQNAESVEAEHFEEALNHAIRLRRQRQ